MVRGGVSFDRGQGRRAVFAVGEVGVQGLKVINAAVKDAQAGVNLGLIAGLLTLDGLKVRKEHIDGQPGPDCET
jgi:hypothetical protein